MEQDDKHERWLTALIELAERRGDAEAVWRRAAGICRQLNVAPWIALGVAERLISLRDAPLLDRAARCKELQAAVLDRKLTLDELKTTMPYAPFLLAAELSGNPGNGTWRSPDVLQVVRALLARERKFNEDATMRPVRSRPLEEYAATLERIRNLQQTTGCDLQLAIDAETGLVDAALVRKHAAERKRVEDLDRAYRERRPFDRERRGRPGASRPGSQPGRYTERRGSA